MTNREKLISHYTKWLKSLDDTDLVFTIELCAETEFCCKHCVFSNKGSSVAARLIVMSMTITQMIVIQMIMPV